MGRWVAFSSALPAPPFALTAVPRGALERPAEAGMRRQAGDAPPGRAVPGLPGGSVGAAAAGGKCLVCLEPTAQPPKRDDGGTFLLFLGFFS